MDSYWKICGWSTLVEKSEKCAFSFFFFLVGTSEEVKSFVAWTEMLSTAAKYYFAAVFLPKKKKDKLQFYIKKKNPKQ